MQCLHSYSDTDPDYTRNIDRYLKRLFPIHRSITGAGNRQTLKILQEIIPLEIIEYPSGQQVYDWTIPKEWNIRDAWIKNDKGEKIVDLKNNNLHVISYSEPIEEILSYERLLPRLHYRRDLPTAIPYRTSYYENNWGFCLSYMDFKQYFFEGKQYEVVIDAKFEDGYLTVGELLVPGKSKKEYLLSSYICHPSMANDNLSGVVLAAFLAKELIARDLNFSYRIIFIPETIGAITYCATHKAELKAIDCGLVISCVGGPGKFGYKQSFNSHHFINRAIEETFKETNTEFVTYPFDIHGSDERQFSSPAFRINTASLCKDRYYEYEYYHTSLDDLDFVKSDCIAQSLELYLAVVDKMDKNLTLVSNNSHCEAMLSKYGLYPSSGGRFLPNCEEGDTMDAALWLLFYSDGNHTLFEISEKCGISLDSLFETSRTLCAKGLLTISPDSDYIQ